MYIFELAGLLLGLLFGSFLNVCISRVPAGQSVVAPRSQCPECGVGIRWFDNIPLVSWAILRARCRDCGKNIPWRYPAVELALGLWLARTGEQFWEIWAAGGEAYRPAFSHAAIFSLEAMGTAVLGFLLIGLIVIDWTTLRLPDEFTFSGIAIALFLVCSQAIFLAPGEDQIVLNTRHQLRLASPGSFAAHGNVFLTGPEALIFGRVASVVGAALLLLAVRWSYKALRKRDGLGLGDVKMLAMIAAFLGFWPAVLSLFVGVVGASIYGTALMLRGRAHGLTRLPLGTFLGFGGLVAALWGDRIVEWYRGLLA